MLPFGCQEVRVHDPCTQSDPDLSAPYQTIMATLSLLCCFFWGGESEEEGYDVTDTETRQCIVTSGRMSDQN